MSDNRLMIAERISEGLAQEREVNSLPRLRILMLCPSLSVKGGMSSVVKLILQQVPAKTKIRHVVTHIEGSKLLRIQVFARAMVETVWRLLTEESDVICIHVSQRGSVVRKTILTLIARLFGKPVVLHLHGSEFRQFYSKSPGWFKAYIRWAFRYCRYFIVLSERWKEFYVSVVGLDAKRVIVLPNPVELPEQVPCRPKTSTVSFLFLGRLGNRKGTFDLIYAFSNLEPEYRYRARLMLGGDGKTEEAQALVDRLELSDSVTVLGWLEPKQRDVMLAQADAFVLPSYNEGLPMAVLEAMGWGLPVITTPVGGLPDLITPGRNGIMVNPGDVASLSAAMQRLIQDRELRLSLGEQARRKVLPQEIGKYCVSLLDVYRAAVNP